LTRRVPHPILRCALASGNQSEAAKQLGVSLCTIKPLISAGRLPLVHVEGAAHVRVADLEAYVQGLESDDRTT
jgi:excisionase family DNA binding protein